MDIQFQYLELIPQLLKKINDLEDKITKHMPPPTSKKEVAKFLGVTPRTINNYMALGILKDGYHFYRKSDRIIVFIESAIIEFRDNLHRGIINEKVAV